MNFLLRLILLFWVRIWNDMVNRYEFERKIKIYISEDGRSQASVARKLGYAPDTFNKWVRGVNRMPDKVIGEFGTLFGLSSDNLVELLKLAGYTVPDARAESERIQDDTKARMLFATQITPSGRALDPGTIFSAHTADLYAVFRPGNTIPGTRVNLAQPEPEAYYAYLKIHENSTMRSLGWRWFLNGKVVNEFQMEVKPRDEVWLQKFSYERKGIFGTAPFWPGIYRIVILLGGNPAISAQVTIVSERAS